MDIKEILKSIEGKEVTEQKRWFLHAVEKDVETIKTILNDGIKCTYLTGVEKPTTCNGKYYVSLFKNNENSSALCQRFENNVKFIITGIRPHYAKSEKYASRECFIDTRIPLRTSHYEGEYHQYLQVDPSKFVGIDYQLSKILPGLLDFEKVAEIEFLKKLVLCIQAVNSGLPIYDLSSKKELNKDKILNLTL